MSTMTQIMYYIEHPYLLSFVFGALTWATFNSYFTAMGNYNKMKNFENIVGTSTFLKLDVKKYEKPSPSILLMAILFMLVFLWNLVLSFGMIKWG